MRAIFISYRRDNAAGEAGRLFDDLAAQFGDKVFMDVAGIEPGRDFRKVIDQNVASCGVLLAMIGKGWIDAKDDAGRRRLDDPLDFVRLETASALKRDIPVIPVLVQGGRMPRAEQLPEDLRDLAYRNAVELTHARWNSDVELLINALRPHVGNGEKSGSAKIEPAPRGASGDGGVVSAVPPRQAKKSWRGLVVASVAAIVLAAGGVATYEYKKGEEATARKAAEEAAAKQAAENERSAAQKEATAKEAAARQTAAKQTAAMEAAAKEAETARAEAAAARAETERAKRDAALRIASEKVAAERAAAQKTADERVAAEKAAAAAAQKTADERAAAQKAAARKADAERAGTAAGKDALVARENTGRLAKNNAAFQIVVRTRLVSANQALLMVGGTLYPKSAGGCNGAGHVAGSEYREAISGGESEQVAEFNLRLINPDDGFIRPYAALWDYDEWKKGKKKAIISIDDFGGCHRLL